LPFDVERGGWHQVSIVRSVPGVAGCLQILIEVRFLLGEAESQPFGEYLVVASAQRAVGVFVAQQAQKLVVTIPASGGVP
jgi:hypothetical protein